MSTNPRSYEAFTLIHEGALAFSRAELQGIRVDVEYVENKKAHLLRKIERIREQFKSTDLFKKWQKSSETEVNIDSHVQLANYLYSVKKIKPKKLTPTGRGSTDEEALSQLNIPELLPLFEAKKYKKIYDFLDGFSREQVNGYLHPFFNLHTVVSFRSSMDSPNLQNIPKRDSEMMTICRSALYPRPGHQLLEIDFSGAEVRVAACITKDSKLIEYIKNPESDMHADMAVQIFKLDSYDKTKYKVLRQAAKNGFVFPEFYGDYFGNCAVNMACTWGKLPQGKWKEGQGIEIGDTFLADHLISKGLISLKKFTDHLEKIEHDFWFNRFSEYSQWKDRWWRAYQKYGYIDTPVGFRFNGLMGRKETWNYPVQASAFHCLLWSFIEIDKVMRKENWDSRIISQIHDSIIIDVNPEELDHVMATARDIMCNKLVEAWKWIIVPIDVEMELCGVDKSWAEKQKVN